MDGLSRQRLSAERACVTRRFVIGGHKFYVRVGLYDDGKPGEVFVTQAGESGTHVAAALDLGSQAVSLALQYGVPLGTFVDHWRGVRACDVCGIPNADPYLSASSIWDAVAKWFAVRWPEQSAAVSIAPAPESETHNVPITGPRPPVVESPNDAR
jgi:ribonucleoside-diphosphate reductase alpha chain